MKKIDLLKAIAIPLLIFCFVFTPSYQNISPKNIAIANSEEYPGEIDEDTTWGAEHATVDYDVIVYEGATLTLQQGNYDFKGSLDIYAGANLVLSGGEYFFEKSIFSDGASIILRKGNYIFGEDFYLNNHSKLNIEAGTNIKFKKIGDYTPGMQLAESTIIAEGTMDEMITFEGADENSGGYSISIGGYDNNEISSFKYINFIGGGQVWESGQAMLKNIFINTVYAAEGIDGKATLDIYDGNVSIDHAKFNGNNYYAINYAWYVDINDTHKALRVVDSDFLNNIYKLAVKSDMRCQYEDKSLCSAAVTLKNNYYNSADGPKSEGNPSGTGNEVTGFVNLDGYNTQSNFTPIISNVPSNVLFLPGLEGSRLYKDGLIGNDELWLPTFASNDMQQLLLNNNGQSIENIFTSDIIESVGGNIYKTFADKLRSLKNDDTINDFNLFAYDWRQSVEDIAQSGTPYAGMIMRSATLQAKALAITSKSKKVTIVAHSNGGLLAKAIMLELKKEGKEDMIDKIVFVASPQMGTPKAITSMLYGYKEGLVSGLLSTDAEMRTLAENMPGAYGLLPSKEYLKYLEDPMIKFSSDNTRYKAFKDAYGEDITKDEYDQFFNFLLGKDDGRTKPDADNTQFENVLNESLLEQAKETHERLDAWTPPVSIKIYEIAGWGLDTISGVEYKEKEGTICSSYNSKVPSCTKTDSFYEPYFDPMWTIDGDKVVVAPSALMLQEGENVKKYWVDLHKINRILREKIEHSKILEINAVDNFISNILTNGDVNTLPDYISKSRPDDYENAKPRLRMSLYSPLDIHLYADGKHTGPITIEENGQQLKTFEEQIPNSYYYQFGERKYVGIPVGENVHMEMNGYGDGAYTLKIEEVKETEEGEKVVAETTFANLAVSPDTKVTLDIPETGLENMPNLKADYDGDGENDYEAAVVLGGEAQIVDNVKPVIEITSPEAKQYLNNQTVDFVYSVMDNLSPQSDIVVQKYLDGNQIDSDKIDLSMLSLGNHAIKIIATDKAGNIQEKEIAFSTTTSLQAIKDNVQKYYDAKLIRSKQQKNVLLVSLEIIEQRLAFLEMIKNNPHISQKAKNMIAAIVKKQIEQHVEFLIKQINHQQKYYDAKIKQLLIEDLQWLENNAAV